MPKINRIERLREHIDDLQLKQIDLESDSVLVEDELNEIESEITSLNEEIQKLQDELDSLERKELESYNDKLIRDNNQLRTAMDNHEVLSREFIDENVVHIRGLGDIIAAETFESLLVPKQEKLLVDKKDAKNIVEYKSEGWTLTDLIYDIGVDAEHDELLARAWLAYPNIEVEEE